MECVMAQHSKPQETNTRRAELVSKESKLKTVQERLSRLRDYPCNKDPRCSQLPKQFKDTLNLAYRFLNAEELIEFYVPFPEPKRFPVLHWRPNEILEDPNGFRKDPLQYQESVEDFLDHAEFYVMTVEEFVHPVTKLLPAAEGNAMEALLLLQHTSRSCAYALSQYRLRDQAWMFQQLFPWIKDPDHALRYPSIKPILDSLSGDAGDACHLPRSDIDFFHRFMHDAPRYPTHRLPRHQLLPRDLALLQTAYRFLQLTLCFKHLVDYDDGGASASEEEEDAAAASQLQHNGHSNGTGDDGSSNAGRRRVLSDESLAYRFNLERLHHRETYVTAIPAAHAGAGAGAGGGSLEAILMVHAVRASTRIWTAGGLIRDECADGLIDQVLPEWVRFIPDPHAHPDPLRRLTRALSSSSSSSSAAARRHDALLLAAAAAFHPRLGAASPLAGLDPELLARLVVLAHFPGPWP